MESGNRLGFLLNLLNLPNQQIIYRWDCRVEADTKESAISLVNVLLSERLKNTDIVAFELPLPIDSTDESPWKKLFGLFKDDADFAEIATAIRAEREVEDDSEVDPSMYLRDNA
jgi:hypothetical protein